MGKLRSARRRAMEVATNSFRGEGYDIERSPNPTKEGSFEPIAEKLIFGRLVPIEPELPSHQDVFPVAFTRNDVVGACIYITNLDE